MDSNSKAKVIFADSRQLDKLLPEKSVDLVLSGPPYWNEVVYSNDAEQLSRIDDYNEFLRQMGEVWKSCSTVLKDGSILAIWLHDLLRKTDSGNYEYIPLHNDIVKTFPVTLTLKNIYVWDRYLNKDRGPLRDPHLGTRLQYVLIFQKKGISANARKIEDALQKIYWQPIWYKKTTPKLLGSSWLFRLSFNLAKPLGRLIGNFGQRLNMAKLLKDEYVFTDYTTECPQDVSDMLVRLFSVPGDTVLDPFTGSGTTLKSALEQSCLGIGVEINKESRSAIGKKLGNKVEFLNI